MDVADDADGRVAIFTVDVAPARSTPERPPPAAGGTGGVGAPGSRLGEVLDSYGPAFIAVGLVVVLVLGLLLTRH
jgi:hypothetical protein